jgi:hypothetical protein
LVSCGVWAQQGSKLVGAGAVGATEQGWSAALSADGNTVLKDNARPEASAVYGAIDMPWAKLVGQIAHAYGK